MKIIQKAIIKKDDKYLVLLRSEKAEFFPSYWDFPGGKLEPNEDLVDGIKREVLEETSLVVDIDKVSSEFEYNIVDKKPGKTKFIIYLTKNIKGKVKISHEHLDYKWATKEEILKLKSEPCIIDFFNN